jgi:hypothetical protein
MKRIRQRHPAYAAFLLAVSFFGLVISIVLLRNPPPFGTSLSYGRTLMVVVYDVVCIAGILAVLFPVTCSRVSGARFPSARPPEASGMRATALLGIVIVHGHHSIGSEVTSHEMLVRGKSFCATCYGLLTGAVASLTLMTAFAVSDGWSWIGPYSAGLIYYVGVAAVIIGLLCPLMISVGAEARFVLALVFVVGTSLMLLATELLTMNLLADLFVVSLAVFWLLSRISMSHRD